MQWSAVFLICLALGTAVSESGQSDESTNYSISNESPSNLDSIDHAEDPPLEVDNGEEDLQIQAEDDVQQASTNVSSINPFFRLNGPAPKFEGSMKQFAEKLRMERESLYSVPERQRLVALDVQFSTNLYFLRPSEEFQANSNIKNIKEAVGEASGKNCLNNIACRNTVGGMIQSRLVNKSSSPVTQLIATVLQNLNAGSSVATSILSSLRSGPAFQKRLEELRKGPLVSVRGFSQCLNDVSLQLNSALVDFSNPASRSLPFLKNVPQTRINSIRENSVDQAQKATSRCIAMAQLKRLDPGYATYFAFYLGNQKISEQVLDTFHDNVIGKLTPFLPAGVKFEFFYPLLVELAVLMPDFAYTSFASNYLLTDPSMKRIYLSLCKVAPLVELPSCDDQVLNHVRQFPGTPIFDGCGYNISMSQIIMEYSSMILPIVSNTLQFVLASQAGKTRKEVREFAYNNGFRAACYFQNSPINNIVSYDSIRRVPGNDAFTASTEYLKNYFMSSDIIKGSVVSQSKSDEFLNSLVNTSKSLKCDCDVACTKLWDSLKTIDQRGACSISIDCFLQALIQLRKLSNDSADVVRCSIVCWLRIIVRRTTACAGTTQVSAQSATALKDVYSGEFNTIMNAYRNQPDVMKDAVDIPTVCDSKCWDVEKARSTYIAEREKGVSHADAKGNLVRARLPYVLFLEWAREIKASFKCCSGSPALENYLKEFVSKWDRNNWDMIKSEFFRQKNRIN